MKKIMLLGAIFGLALFLRILFVMNFPITEVAGDALMFDRIAVDLSGGRGYPATAERSPIYPLVLGLLYYFAGHSYFAAQMLQAVLGSLACVLVYFLARDVFNHKVALISAIIVAVYPIFVGMSRTLLSEPLFIVLLCLALYLLNGAINEMSTTKMVVSGILMGLVTLTRPVTLFYPIFLMFVLFLLYAHWQRAIVHWLVFTLSMIAVIAPWTYRNYLVFNTFLPVSVYGGQNMWAGSYLPWKGRYLGSNSEPLKSYSLQINSEQARVKVDKMLYSKALENIVSDPLGYLGLCFRKIPFLFAFSGGDSMGLKAFHDCRFYEPQFWILVLMYSGNVLLPILTLLSFVFNPMQWKKKILVFSIILYCTCLYLASVASPRYNFPIMPLMVIFAVYAVLNLVNLFKQYRTREIGL